MVVSTLYKCHMLANITVVCMLKGLCPPHDFHGVLYGISFYVFPAPRVCRELQHRTIYLNEAVSRENTVKRMQH